MKNLLIKALLSFSGYPSSVPPILMGYFGKGSNSLLALRLIYIWETNNVCLLAKPQLYN